MPGTNTNKNTSGTWVFVHNQKETKELVQELFVDRDKTEEELAAEQNAANNTTSSDKATSSTTKKSSLKIEVLNGSGASKNLQTVVNDLKKAGYNVTKTGETNATSKTTIIDKKEVNNTNLQEIKDVLETGVIQNSQSSSSKVDVTIIIGKDYK